MSFTYREWWGLIHGMGLGALFLLAFAGGLAGLYSLRPALLTRAGVAERMRRLKIGVIAMAVVAWLTVISGTWIVYPWYREDTPSSAKSKHRERAFETRRALTISLVLIALGLLGTFPEFFQLFAAE
jgi:hypothetical protein